MSLAVLADHMASKGRGPDSMLIHMSPREVQGLQALAMKHGGSLTINPDTGLPEAGFLDKLLPAILGAGLSLIPGVGPAMAAGIVGGIQTVRTGDIGKGLMAGLGAYGGAGLTQGLTTAGASQLAGEALVPAAAEQAAIEGITLPSNYAEMAARTVTPEQIAAAQQTASPMDLISKGATRIAANPMDFATKDNFKYLAAGAAPILADQAVKSNLPTTTTKPGMIRPYAFDPYGGSYTAGTPYEAVPTKAAEGGLMGMNDGGYSPGQLDFAQHSEPVLRMAAGGVPGYAGNEGSLVNDEQVFNYFKGLDQSKLNSGALDAQIAADMQKYKVNPEDIARITGTQDRVADYQRRFAAQQPVTTGGLDTLAANQVVPPRPIAPDLVSPLIVPSTPAPVQGTPITGGLDSLAANQTATADANAAAKLGVFQTVYDPKTGREFNSPAQAAQYGVTDYVTEMPFNRAFMQTVDDTAKNKINSLMAEGQTFEQALDSIGSQFGMTGKQFYNSEVQGGLNYADQQKTRNAVATESGGLKPDELIAKLQAYKDKPPTTAQEFADQRALYADYQNRYANSSWNYANMGGKAQDYSLKPSDYLGIKFSGYADPINFALSNMKQNSQEFKDMSKILTANPEINDVIDQLYKINPEASVFNYINPKYAGGTEKSTMASNFNVILQNLANDVKRYGSAEAMRRFVDQQQNLLGTRPDAQGKLGNSNQVSMANPEYRALNAIKDSYTPIVDDTAWNERIKNETGTSASIGSVYRDADTGKGLAIQYNQRGNAQEVRFIDQQGQGTNVPLNDPAKLLAAFYESGMPSSAFTELSKAFGSEYLIPPPKADEKQYFLPALQNGVKFSDFANGNVANVLSSDSYLKDVQNRALADYQWSIKHGTPENAAALQLQRTVDKAVNDQKIAKAFLGDQGAAAPTGLAALAANQTATTQGAAAPTGVAALAANTGITAPNTGAAQFAAANNINLSKNISDWIAAHPNATDAQVDAEMAKYGVTGEDVAKALSQYGGSKGLSWALNQGNMGLAGLNKNILDYVASHGNTATDRIVAENTLAKYGLNEADVKRATGKTLDELFAAKKAIDTGTKTDTGTKVITKDDGTKVTRVTTPTNITTAPDVTLPPGIGGNTGPSIIGGGTTVNPNGTITTSPRIPGIPVGGFTGMTSLRDAYTRGGGSLGYIPETPKTIEEFDAKYNKLTGGSKQEYDYLMGKTPYSPVPYTPTGEIMKPYWESVGKVPVNLATKKYIFKDGKYELNPAYVKPPYVLAGEKAAAAKETAAADAASGKSIYVTDNQGNSEQATLRGDGFYYTSSGNKYDEKGVQVAAGGGLMALADGGITGSGQLNLNIPLNLGGGSGYNGYGAMGGGFGSTPSNFANNMGSAISNNMNAGMPDFRNQIQGFEAQIQKLPSVMAYNDYGKSLGISGGNDRPLTAEEQARMQELQKAVQSDKGYLDLQSQMRGVENKYQQQAMRSQSSGLQQRYMQQAPNVKAFATGGMSSQYDLGDYSDGGRLLRGPGDGVSDSIPASIGNKRPARLADGEFVVPARIVSELGNGSTEAGARKLYAMMDRIQAARRGTVGKGRVAKNSRADKHLPA